MISTRIMSGLYTALMNQTVDALRSESADRASINQAARDSINKRPDGGVFKYVYEAYSPTFYERRYENGGLADDANLYTNSVTAGRYNVTIEFEDRTREWHGGSWIIPDKAFYVSDLVEQGTYGDKWPYSQIWYSQQARPYLDNSLADGSGNGEIIDRAIEDAVANLQIRW